MRDETLIDRRVNAADFGIRLFDVDNRRVGIEPLAEGKRDNFAVKENCAAFELERVEVIKNFVNRGLLVTNERVVGIRAFVRFVPGVKLCAALRNNFFGNRHVLRVGIFLLEGVEMIFFAVKFSAAQVNQVLRKIDVIETVALGGDVEFGVRINFQLIGENFFHDDVLPPRAKFLLWRPAFFRAHQSVATPRKFLRRTRKYTTRHLQSPKDNCASCAT